MKLWLLDTLWIFKPAPCTVHMFEYMNSLRILSSFVWHVYGRCLLARALELVVETQIKQKWSWNVLKQNIMFNPSKRVSIVYNGWNCSRAPACILSLSRMPHVVSVILPMIVSLWWSFPALICAELHLRRWRPNHQGLWHCTPEAQRTSGNIRVQKFDCVTCMTMYLDDRYVMILNTIMHVKICSNQFWKKVCACTWQKLQFHLPTWTMLNS